jgi:integrase
MRRLLLNLWEHHGAAKLDTAIPHYPPSRPRNVTASRAEIDALLAAVKPSVRLFLLFCSDLAIRSGTANKICPANYDPEKAELRFVTKGASIQTLPITTEIRELIAPLDHQSTTPYVWQLRDKERQPGTPTPTVYEVSTLRREANAARTRLGLKRFTPHDLRRTTAVAMLNATMDLRDVKALLGHADMKTTLAYLDHDTATVNRHTLELLKRTPGPERKLA